MALFDVPLPFTAHMRSICSGNTFERELRTTRPAQEFHDPRSPNAGFYIALRRGLGEPRSAVRPNHYDNALRISSASDNYGSGYTWTLGYDALDHLTTASKSGASFGWTYDTNGNRLTQTGTNATTFAPATTNNRLASTTGSLIRTYGYDNAGDTSSYASSTFTYNQRGRLSSVSGSSTSYTYNALGQMIAKSSPTSTTLLMYDEAGHLLGEYSGSGALIQETVWFGDIPVATIRPNGTGVSFYFVQTDQLNAPRAIARTSDHRPVWRWDPDPFGTAAPNQNPYGFGTFVYNLRFPDSTTMQRPAFHTTGSEIVTTHRQGATARAIPSALLAA